MKECKRRFLTFHNKLCNKSVTRTIYLLIASIIISLSSYLFLKVHRIYNLSDLLAIWKVYNSTKYLQSERCKYLDEKDIKCLPNLFIIGVSKSGTTSLSDYLKKFPSIHFVQRFISHSYDKHSEIHRFDRSQFNQYTMKFIELHHEWASSPVIRDAKDLIVHYTPHYIYAPTVPFEMKEFYPHTTHHQDRDLMKFIIMIRDPLQRALSSYWFKHSHIFNENHMDTGSIDDFLQHYESSVQYRVKYERCMINELSTSFTNLRVNSMTESSIHDTRRHYLQVLFDYLFDNFKLNFSNYNHSERYRYQTIYKSSQAWSIRPSIFNTLTRDEYKRRSLFSALRTCFGSEFRSPKLGLRHIDKGIYIDQILRWLINFSEGHHQYLILPTTWLATDPKAVLKATMQFTIIECDRSTSATNKENEQLLTQNDTCHSSIDCCYQSMIQRYLPVESIQRLKSPNNRSNSETLSTDDEQMISEFYHDYNHAFEQIIV